MSKTKLKQKLSQFALIATVSSLLLLGITQGVYSTINYVGFHSGKAGKFVGDWCSLRDIYQKNQLQEDITAIVRYKMELAKQDFLKVNGVKAEAEAEPELSMEEWVLKQFKDNGLNPDVANCVITQESRWGVNKIGKTYDFGIMQWHRQHIDSGYISLECTGNYKCAVNKAIEKIKKDNGWSAWYGYKDANCQRFGKTFIN